MKYKPDGTLDCHKARLIAKGNTLLQKKRVYSRTYGIESIDYQEAFELVAKINIVKAGLLIARYRGAIGRSWCEVTLGRYVLPITKLTMLPFYVKNIVNKGHIEIDRYFTSA